MIEPYKLKRKIKISYDKGFQRGTGNGERFFLKHIEIARVFIIKKNPFAPYIPGGADPGFGPSFFAFPVFRSPFPVV
jgi:hypothetical protein